MRRFDDEIPAELATELVLENAFEDLLSPYPSGTHLEDALETFRLLRRIETKHTRRFLNLSAQRASSWIGEVGDEPVFQAILPHLEVIRQATEKDPSRQEEFGRLSGTILSEFVKTNPEAYDGYLRNVIRQGRFGTAPETLTNLFIRVSSPEFQRTGDFDPDDEERSFAYMELVMSIFNDLASYQDPASLERVADYLPGELLFSGIGSRSPSLSRVVEILKEKQTLAHKIAETVAKDPDFFDMDLEKKVVKGEYGEPEAVFRELFTYLSVEKNLPKKRSSEYEEDYNLLMPILLEGVLQFNGDKKTIISLALKQDWYWQREGVAFLCFEALNALGLPPERTHQFIWQHEEQIFKKLRADAEKNQAKVLDQIKEQGDFAEKLGNTFQLIKENPDIFLRLGLENDISDDFLTDVLIHSENFAEFVRIKHEIHGFFDLFEQGKPLNGRAREIIQGIVRSPRPLQRALEVQAIFTKNIPFWKQVFLYIDTLMPDEISFSKSSYPIRISAEFVVPPGGQFDFTRNHEIYEEDIASLPVYEKRRLALNGFNNLTDEQVEKITRIPFRLLSRDAKKNTILNYLRTTMELSQSLEVKQQADERNRRVAKERLVLSERTYLHGSDIRDIDSVLYHGNLSGECLGVLRAKTDSYPFHVDVSRISAKESLEAIHNTRKVIEGTYSHSYGNIIYLYARGENSRVSGVGAANPTDNHRLVFIGIPSTEITGIILKEPIKQIEEAKQSILENGFYIPIYDLDGKLLFTGDEFDNITQERNLKVHVEVWSTSLQIGERKGSNEGGEFVIPSEKGTRRFYLKYHPKQDAGVDHLWTEQLADNIYRFIGIPVPETKIVRVDDKFGHASEILEPDPNKDLTTLKDGFLIDALLANWDVVYNPGNTISVGGIIYRIDNGGALHYSAKGNRKDDDVFGTTVKELKYGSDRKRLGLGMRQEYQGLTQEDISRQVESLQINLAPSTIDTLIDGVRLPALDRAFLKNRLLQRRNYILSYYQNPK